MPPLDDADKKFIEETVEGKVKPVRDSQEAHTKKLDTVERESKDGLTSLGNDLKTLAGKGKPPDDGKPADPPTDPDPDKTKDGGGEKGGSQKKSGRGFRVSDFLPFALPSQEELDVDP